jgi:hypothetical protein
MKKAFDIRVQILLVILSCGTALTKPATAMASFISKGSLTVHQPFSMRWTGRFGPKYPVDRQDLPLTQGSYEVEIDGWWVNEKGDWANFLDKLNGQVMKFNFRRPNHPYLVDAVVQMYTPVSSGDGQSWLLTNQMGQTFNTLVNVRTDIQSTNFRKVLKRCQILDRCFESGFIREGCSYKQGQQLHDAHDDVTTVSVGVYFYDPSNNLLATYQGSRTNSTEVIDGKAGTCRLNIP